MRTRRAGEWTREPCRNRKDGVDRVLTRTHPVDARVTALALLQGVWQCEQIMSKSTSESVHVGQLDLGRTILGRYDIVGVIGKGGYGEVYKAKQHATQ